MVSDYCVRLKSSPEDDLCGQNGLTAQDWSGHLEVSYI